LVVILVRRSGWLDRQGLTDMRTDYVCRKTVRAASSVCVA